ncbi:MAG: IS200/IS605 family transposase [Ktedonobacterales bacterium]
MREMRNAVFLHYVWSTWDRAPLLIGETRSVAYRAIGAKCHALGADLVALGGIDDHVHLLIQLPPTLGFAALIKEIKGSSGHLLAKRAMLSSGDFFKWEGSYAVFSVSPHELKMATKYIKQQEKHHAEQSVIPRWELLPRLEAG